MTLKTGLFGLISFLQGACMLLLPASSAILLDEPYFSTAKHYGYIFIPGIGATILFNYFFDQLVRWKNKGMLFYLGLCANILHLLFFLSVDKLLLFSVFIQLMIASACFGIGFALVMTCVNIYMVDLYPEKRGQAIAVMHALLGLGASISPLLLSFYAKNYYWTNYIQILMSIYCFLLAVSLIVKITAIEDAYKPIISNNKVAEGKVVCIFAALFVYGLVEAVAINWSIPYIHSEREIDYAVGSMALGVFMLAITLGRLLVPVFLKFTSEARLYALSPFIVALALISITIFVNQKFLLPLYFCLGLGCSYFIPLSISLATQGHEENKDRISSLAICFLMSGVGTATVLTGYIIDTTTLALSTIFQLIAFFSFLVGLMIKKVVY